MELAQCKLRLAGGRTPRLAGTPHASPARPLREVMQWKLQHRQSTLPVPAKPLAKGTALRLLDVNRTAPKQTRDLMSRAAKDPKVVPAMPARPEPVAKATPVAEAPPSPALAALPPFPPPSTQVPPTPTASLAAEFELSRRASEAPQPGQLIGGSPIVIDECSPSPEGGGDYAGSSLPTPVFSIYPSPAAERLPSERVGLSTSTLSERGTPVMASPAKSVHRSLRLGRGSIASDAMSTPSIGGSPPKSARRNLCAARSSECGRSNGTFDCTPELRSPPRSVRKLTADRRLSGSGATPGTAIGAATSVADHDFEHGEGQLEDAAPLTPVRPASTSYTPAGPLIAPASSLERRSASRRSTPARLARVLCDGVAYLADLAPRSAVPRSSARLGRDHEPSRLLPGVLCTSPRLRERASRATLCAAAATGVRFGVSSVAANTGNAAAAAIIDAKRNAPPTLSLARFPATFHHGAGAEQLTRMHAVLAESTTPLTTEQFVVILDDVKLGTKRVELCARVLESAGCTPFVASLALLIPRCLCTTGRLLDVMQSRNVVARHVLFGGWLLRQ